MKWLESNDQSIAGILKFSLFSLRNLIIRIRHTKLCWVFGTVKREQNGNVSLDIINFGTFATETKPKRGGLCFEKVKLRVLRSNLHNNCWGIRRVALWTDSVGHMLRNKHDL